MSNFNFCFSHADLQEGCKRTALMPMKKNKKSSYWFLAWLELGYSPADFYGSIQIRENLTDETYLETLEPLDTAQSKEILEFDLVLRFAPVKTVWHSLQQEEMVESVPSSGIPLQEFRRDVPPGWIPGLPDYPLRLYFEKLKLW